MQPFQNSFWFLCFGFVSPTGSSSQKEGCSQMEAAQQQANQWLSTAKVWTVIAEKLIQPLWISQADEMQAKARTIAESGAKSLAVGARAFAAEGLTAQLERRVMSWRSVPAAWDAAATSIENLLKLAALESESPDDKRIAAIAAAQAVSTALQATAAGATEALLCTGKDLEPKSNQTGYGQQQQKLGQWQQQH
eukprot:gnl/MRDRNA2_/MRDRNA2_70003_c0_seq3.p2 gnl/MRDRNA2_/MRDRNA2_70003_c0~~gnl/MRDRNA2_/MRDRNA2_70003_c0_seq3.p2  ORF type:complete len:193 (+),score=48.16 gnl/MRDRNA2_/MRDRNA2_70003_c0_seq3:65-643(+)